jgi:ribosomal protein S18 acetylase RimI-like enzyme
MNPELPQNDLQLIPASQFNYEELAAIYNQTRVDYLVPMPMNAARLAEYVHAYDVNLEQSLVATTPAGEMLGVAMLGIRTGRTWLTRLGVIPNTRRHGVGQALVNSLIERSTKLGRDFMMLEVIKHNTPAHQLFLKSGFVEMGELLVLRRSPLNSPLIIPVGTVEPLERAEALELAARPRGTQPWTNQSESLVNVGEVEGFQATLADGSRGWLVYQHQKFILTRFAYQTETGLPAQVLLAILAHLHGLYPRLDTQLENIQVNDPHLPAFVKLGYVEAFRRIEMWRGQPDPTLGMTYK